MLTFAERLAELAAVSIDAGVYVKAGLLTVVYWGNFRRGPSGFDRWSGKR